MTHTTLPHPGRKGDLFMNTQLHMAFGIVGGRVWNDQDYAILRDVEVARQAERRARRGRHFLSR